MAESLTAESVQPTQGFETQVALVKRVDMNPQTEVVWTLESATRRNVYILLEEECESEDEIKVVEKGCAFFEEFLIRT